MLDWINARMGTELTEEGLTNVKNFSLLWNVFEKKVCDTRCSIPILEKKLNLVDFDLNEFEEHLEYFKNRYISEGQINQRFDHLRVNNLKYKGLVINVLLGDETEDSDIILALMVIVYRYRNNLFQGNKDILHLNTQEVNFHHANQILKKILNEYL